MDPQTNEFEVLRVIRGDDTFCMNAYQVVEMFSLHNRSWKQLNRESVVMFSDILDNRDTEAYLEGFSFWYADALKDNVERIVRFDFSNETFQTTPLPAKTVIGRASDQCHILKVLNRSLSLMVLKDWNQDPYFEIWVLLEFEVRASWTKLFKIDCSNDIRILLGFWKNAKLFLNKKGELVLYDPLTKTIESVHPGQISKELQLVQCSIPKEYVELTKGDICLEPSKAVGMDPQTNEFEVLRVIRGDDTFCMNAYQVVEMFSLHNRSWKQLNCESDVMFSDILDNRDTEAYLEGFSFWYADALKDNVERINRFDFSNETFQTTPLPAETVIRRASDQRHILKVLNKSLSLMVLKDWNQDPYFEIWVLLEFEVRASWTKLFKIDCSNDIQILLGFWKNAKIFLNKKGELVLYDPLTKTIESVHPSQISKELQLVQCSIPKEYVELTEVW
nr:f-box protein cpr30 [Quercus suber]